MIAANGVTAKYLARSGYASLRRVLRSPERWERIVALAAGLGEQLPPAPDAVALDAFLARRRQADPVRFPDLSLTIIKLLGKGEYVLERPDRRGEGHFGLAVRDYTHATAPNRRYPDLIVQRLLKAALVGDRTPYPDDELAALAQHCTDQEDNAAKVERQVRKSAAALLLERRIGERFDAIVTGASEKGTWVRIERPDGRRKGRAGLRGARRRRPGEGRAPAHRRRARLHRLRASQGDPMSSPPPPRPPLAYLNAEFLETDDARPLRILAEYLAPAAKLSPRPHLRHRGLLRIGAARIGRPARALLRRRARARAPAHAVVEEPADPTAIASSSAPAEAAASWRPPTGAHRRPAARRSASTSGSRASSAPTPTSRRDCRSNFATSSCASSGSRTSLARWSCSRAGSARWTSCSSCSRSRRPGSSRAGYRFFFTVGSSGTRSSTSTRWSATE